MFAILVIMAIFSTVITSPLLRRWLPQVGIPVPVNSKRPSTRLTSKTGKRNTKPANRRVCIPVLSRFAQQLDTRRLCTRTRGAPASNTGTPNSIAGRDVEDSAMNAGIRSGECWQTASMVDPRNAS
jgi:hypothetical protein